VECGPLAAPLVTEPRELLRRHERQRLVRRLEDLASFIELVAPGRVVARNTSVQHQVMIPAGDRDRVELDRPESTDHLEHAFGAARYRSGGCEEVPRDEKATGRVSSHFHEEDTSVPRDAGPVEALARADPCV